MSLSKGDVIVMLVTLLIVVAAFNISLTLLITLVEIGGN
jgi:hypothetical protein